MVTALALLGAVVAALAFAYAWRLQQEVEQLVRRLDRYNRALFDASDQLRQMEDELKQTAAALRVEIMQQAGTVRFTPGTTVREATFIHPQATQMLASFHVGGCSNCAVGPDATLAEVCEEKGVDIDALLTNLNLLAQASNGGQAGPVKIPNMTLELS